MKDIEFLILQAVDSLGGQAGITDILERVKANPGSVRRFVSRLSIKEDLIKQPSGSYWLSYLGRERYLTELGYREPHSPLVKRERKRKRVVYPVTVQALDEGGFLAVCEAIQGCHAEGSTVAEALLYLEDGAVELLKMSKEHGQSIPNGIRQFDAGGVLQAQLVVPMPE